MSTLEHTVTAPEEGRTRNMVVLKNAVKYFRVPRRSLLGRAEHVHSVDGVTLTVGSGEALGLVGESGSGKSTLARVILRLLATTSGTVEVDGRDVTRLDAAERRRLRRAAQLVFQDPHAAMDPRMTIGESLTAVLAQHRICEPQDRRARVAERLDEVGLDATYLDRYPSECSGGQLQRVGIARALLLDPKILVCDEPTSALDASVQARVLNLISKLRRERELTLIMISHDLRVVRFLCDRVAVMYLGQIVEVAESEALFTGAMHPYTIALLEAAASDSSVHDPAVVATGEPPSPIHPPSGCRFSTRCPLADQRCRTEQPELVEVADGHEVRCHRWTEARELLRCDAGEMG
ncbi:ABC transporter ATP-binding protein [Georgenia sp. SUBG003]|uniref:ABC transporter ATP-binding protein n=1 Tax=Georgenia sp. SUBG003 TaxID=1497974 RepID=UPI000694F763